MTGLKTGESWVSCEKLKKTPIHLAPEGGPSRVQGQSWRRLTCWSDQFCLRCVWTEQSVFRAAGLILSDGIVFFCVQDINYFRYSVCHFCYNSVLHADNNFSILCLSTLLQITKIAVSRVSVRHTDRVFVRYTGKVSRVFVRYTGRSPGYLSGIQASQ